MTENLYQPILMRVADVRDEAPEVRTFRLQFADDADRARFFEKYRVGMFGLYGVPGAGESVFCVASPPTRQEYIECTFRRTGRVTSALADREVGQPITFRGPYGNSFPIESWRGKNILFVAGSATSRSFTAPARWPTLFISRNWPTGAPAATCAL